MGRKSDWEAILGPKTDQNDVILTIPRRIQVGGGRSAPRSRLEHFHRIFYFGARFVALKPFLARLESLLGRSGPLLGRSWLIRSRS